MKNTKRLVAFLLIMAMTLSLCSSSVFAADRISDKGGKSWGWTKSEDDKAKQDTAEEEAAPEDAGDFVVEDLAVTEPEEDAFEVLEESEEEFFEEAEEDPNTEETQQDEDLAVQEEVPIIVRAAKASDELAPPEVAKTLTDNGDGTETLSLSIKGSAESSTTIETTGANVVIVVDCSTSMNIRDINTAGQYGYSGTFNSLGNNTYVKLYYKDGNNYVDLTTLTVEQIQTNGWTGNTNIYTRNTYGSGYSAYNGTYRFVEKDRITGTKEIVNDLVDTLYAEDAGISLGVISFNSSATTRVSMQKLTASNVSSIKSTVSGLGLANGTNWTGALQAAYDMANTVDSEEVPTFVIFMTDGTPYPDSADGGDWGKSITGLTNTKLFCLYTFGLPGNSGAAQLKGLADDAGATFYNTSNIAQLKEAFEDITHEITKSLSYGQVSFTDTITTDVTSTSLTLTGTAGQFSYEVKDDKGNVVASWKDGETAYDNIPSASFTNGTVVWNLGNDYTLKDKYTYTVSFVVWPNQEGYDLVADANNGIATAEVWDETKQEEVTNSSGQVLYYKGGFTKYPSIVKYLDGSYGILTNSEQKVTYRVIRTVNDETYYSDPITTELDPPAPVALQGSLLPIRKAWESGLSEAELNEYLWKDGVVNGTSNERTVTLYIWKAETLDAAKNMAKTGLTETNEPYITEELGWDSEAKKYVWQKDGAVAPGTMLNVTRAAELGFDTTAENAPIRVYKGKSYYVVEPGHYYAVSEAGGDLHFELDDPLYHPMIVDGVLYNVFFGSGNTVEKMDPMSEVVGTNVLKGGLNINKVVSSTQINVTEEDVIGEDDEPTGDKVKVIKNCTKVTDCEDEFAFKITLWKLDDKGAVQPVYTFDDQFNGVNAITGSIGYREFGVDDQGNFVTLGRNVILFENSTNAAAKIEANKRGDNDPVYATLTSDNKTQIILRIPANGEIRIVNLPSHTYYTVEEIVDTAGAYTYAATESKIKYDDAHETEGAVTTANTVNGLVLGNQASVETYYNWSAFFYVYHSATKAIEKISFSDKRVEGTYDANNSKYTYSFNMVEETGRSSADSEVTAVPVKDENDDLLSYRFTGSYLYGGYYKVFSGAGVTDAQIAGTATADNVTFTKNWATDSAGTAYDAKKANVWKAANAYTDTADNTLGGGTGTAMKPKANVVYYLKEVPTGYIRPYIHFTYDDVASDKPIKKLYLITATDDTNYDFAGYILSPATSGTAAPNKSLVVTIKKADKTIDATLTAKSVFNEKYSVTRGYLYWDDLSKQIGKDFTYQPCWNTLDDVLVKGVMIRTVKDTASQTTINVDDVVESAATE